MIAFPEHVKKENIRVYLRLKWFVISGIFLLNAFENLNGIVTLKQAGVVYLICLIAALPALYILLSIKREKLPDIVTHISLALDTALVFLALYFNGGVENSWLHLPIFVTFLASYIFGFVPGLLYATYSFIILAAMSAMQYFGAVPTYPLFNLGEAHWKNPQYMIDVLTGIFVLYMSSAIAIGLMNQHDAARAERVDDYAGKIGALASGEADAKEKLRHAKVEFMVKSAELERLLGQSAERQMELIGLKSELERLMR